MTRMGHASPRAALIYQHATRERDAHIANMLNDFILKAVAEVSDRETWQRVRSFFTGRRHNS